jgi:uncharacterized protein
MQPIETNLETILAKTNFDEQTNDRFSEFLSRLDSAALDEEIFKLEKIITPQIDCTNCGNCCKSLMVNINEEEADRASGFLNKSREEFDELFIEKSEAGKMLINTIPCHFLHNNACSIYEVRFEGCREFPALHLTHFQKRLFTVFMHYSRCPIIFNVMEELKEVVGFE